MVLDSASAARMETYVSLRDTLRTLAARSALLQRDVRTASSAVLHSRARGLAESCRASLRHLDRQWEGLVDGSAGRDAAARQQELQRSATGLRATLNDCAAEYTELSERERAPEMRGRGITQARENQEAVRAFESASEKYLLSLGIKVRPYGSGASSYAGSARQGE